MNSIDRRLYLPPLWLLLKPRRGKRTAWKDRGKVNL